MENNIKYFEEKFNRVFDKLDSIDERTAKINGKVAEHEQRLQLMEKEEIKHYANCPNTKMLTELNNELMEYKMLKKYPKIALYLGGLVLLQAAVYIMDKLNVF